MMVQRVPINLVNWRETVDEVDFTILNVDQL